MKKALVIGASSGIGRALAITLAKHGYEVGLMARRLECLEALQREISTTAHVGYVDLARPDEAIAKTQELIDRMGGLDLMILNAGVVFLNLELEWALERETLEVNVLGFCALAGVGYNYFSRQGHGHLVGISSVRALRGYHLAPAYAASKAFVSNYLEGLRYRAEREKKPIAVTEALPGYVDTEMLMTWASEQGIFWVASAEEAAEQVYQAIEAKKKRAYITRRWSLIGWAMRLAPDWLYTPTQ